MGYVIASDYIRIIQQTELDAITSRTPTVRMLAEQSVATEIRSSLIQRFDMDSEFMSLDPYSPALIYKGKNRVYLDAPPYDPTFNYLGTSQELVLQTGLIYITRNNTTGTFNPNDWTLLGNQYDLFYVTLPYTEFSPDKFYTNGVIVWFRDSIYTCQRDSVVFDQQDQLQYAALEDIRRGNVLPDAGKQGLSMWGIGVPYSISPDNLPTNTALWTKGDNRNQELLKFYLDIVVYDLCVRVAPNNVPEARHNRWLAAQKGIDKFADGKRNAQLPILEPRRGERAHFGGAPPKAYDVW